MSLVYTPTQLAVAKESYVFWRSKLAGHIHACALVGNEGGETGFKWSLVEGVMRTPAGDKDHAFGAFQWHAARAILILQHASLDVIKGSHLEMLNGAFEEMTGPWSVYRNVWPALMATMTIADAVNVLVQKYEQSASRLSDDVKRTAIAAYFDLAFKDYVA